MSTKTLLLYLLIYVVGFIATFGLFYRDQQVRVGTKQIMAAVAWPIWWPIANGFGTMFDLIYSTLTATAGRMSISFGFALFAATDCLLTSWSECKETVTCTAVVAKSAAMFFPPLNFIYAARLALQQLL